MRLLLLAEREPRAERVHGHESTSIHCLSEMSIGGGTGALDSEVQRQSRWTAEMCASCYFRCGKWEGRDSRETERQELPGMLTLRLSLRGWAPRRPDPSALRGIFGGVTNQCTNTAECTESC